MDEDLSYDIPIPVAKELLVRSLRPLGLTSFQLTPLVENLILAEMAEKHSHGFARACWILENVRDRKLHTLANPQPITFDQKGSLLFVNAHQQLGPYAFSGALFQSFELLKKEDLVVGFVSHIGPYSGYIGAYALEAMERDCLFLSFVDSPSGVVPYGGSHELWGTDVITFGFPDLKHPILVDTALSEETLGQRYLRHLMTGSVLDQSAIEPIAQHKGSSLIFLSKILAGSVGRTRKLAKNERTSGIFFLLINKSVLPTREFAPELFAEIFTQMQGSIDGSARFPGSSAIQKIRDSRKRGTVHVPRTAYKILVAWSQNNDKFY